MALVPILAEMGARGIGFDTVSSSACNLEIEVGLPVTSLL
jgi:hypothetical protein